GLRGLDPTFNLRRNRAELSDRLHNDVWLHRAVLWCNQHLSAFEVVTVATTQNVGVHSYRIAPVRFHRFAADLNARNSRANWQPAIVVEGDPGYLREPAVFFSGGAHTILQKAL